MRRKLGQITLTVYATDQEAGKVQIEVPSDVSLERDLALMFDSMNGDEKSRVSELRRAVCESAANLFMFMRNPDKREKSTAPLPGIPSNKKTG